MQTVFDWLAIAVFAGLTVLFLQRSAAETSPDDKIWHYAPPAVGCAASNYVGNLGLQTDNPMMQIFAFVVLGASALYIFQVLKPFAQKK